MAGQRGGCPQQAVPARLTRLRVADYASTGDRAFVGREGRSTYGLVFTSYTGELSPPSLGPQITAAMIPRLPPGSTVTVTGMNELQSGGQAEQGFGVLAETLLAGAAALAVLVVVFGSALALVPLLMAAVAIPACFLAIYGLAEITTVSVIVQYLAALIGLGVAIDYSLLLVTRWREELAVGRPGQEAVRRAMTTAGRSVAFSGITVAIGLLSLIVYGYGSHAIWGLPATGAITNWLPLIAFAFLYGLSMDYEVFILTRIREERDRTGSTTTAVAEGIGRTGRLVTGAALILFFAFAALSTGPETDLKVMATALGAGILLDATVVRALLVPALVAILGKWNWWLPHPAQRLLRVPAPPSPARPVTHTTIGTRP